MKIDLIQKENLCKNVKQSEWPLKSHFSSCLNGNCYLFYVPLFTVSKTYSSYITCTTTEIHKVHNRPIKIASINLFCKVEIMVIVSLHLHTCPVVVNYMFFLLTKLYKLKLLMTYLWRYAIDLDICPNSASKIDMPDSYTDFRYYLKGRNFRGKKISREENFANFANFGQIRENKFLFWPPKMLIREN